MCPSHSFRFLPRYSVIIPAYNEEARIAATLEDYAGVFSESELIVVLNGCTDRTAEVVGRFVGRCPNIRLITIDYAVGKGGAVRAGFLLARAPLIGYVDADGATSAEEMLRLFHELENDRQADGIIASRWLPGSMVRIEQTHLRRFVSRAFNLLTRVLFGLHYADTQCGAKVFRAEALGPLMREVETSNLAFDVDLLVAMKRHGRQIREVPTDWSDKVHSKVNVANASIRMAAAIFRLRLQHSFFRIALPTFDRLFPTKPVKARWGLNVLFINWRDIRNPRAGGAEVFVQEVGRRLVQTGHHVELLTAGFSGAPKIETIDGIRIRRVGSWWSVYALVPFVYLREFRDRFDVIIDAENGIPFFSPLFSMKPKICLMHHVHQRVFRQHLPWPIAQLFCWMEAKLMPAVYRNCRFVAVSEDTRKEMQEFAITNHPIDIVYNGVDERLKPGNKSAIPIICYVGRLKAYKRVDLLVREFAMVLDACPEAVLVLAGDGEERSNLERLVASLHISNSVRFEGFVSDERKAEILGSSWLFCSASEMEGWGISVIEAAAAGTPAVSFDVPGLREAISHGESGLLCPSDGRLSSLLTTLLQDEHLRDRLSRGAIERAKRFSWSESSENLVRSCVRSIIGDDYNVVKISDDWYLLQAATKRGVDPYVLGGIAAKSLV